jgi:hypothetical protein
MDTQSGIVFLSVPESLRGRVESLTSHSHEGHGHGHGNDDDDDAGFSIDPAIPIPV